MSEPRERKPAVMVMGTGSNVGKSTLVAGLCRIFVKRGLNVRPFKPQNMSNNAAAVEGGEIGRAQVVQALAAKVPASVHMNPVLLKPEADNRSQIIVQGKRFGLMRARDFGARRETLMPHVMDSFARLEREADLVIVEGAGSPAEINLRRGDIANMGFAEEADIPVILAGDIDRGGVIASLVGTHAVLPDDERERIKAFLINKFRGDVSLFDDGLKEIASRTGWRSLGVAPWLPEAAWLPAEDALDLEREKSTRGRKLKIATPVIARIANFDDLDPLGMESDVELVFVRPGEPLPGDADLVVLPGSKSTIADLAFFRAQGWDIDLAAHVRRGGHVLGLCGGYQMLGKTIADPDGIEGKPESVAGLGFLDVHTTLSGDKITRSIEATHLATETPIRGYEIHLGQTSGADCERPVIAIDGKPDGATSRDGRVAGTYAHGFFVSDAFRSAYLRSFGAASSLAYAERVEQALEALADHLERHLDIDAILDIARQRSRTKIPA
ncbi:cobyric acid synthase [Terrarubrum flagellatum]|uniref:cobyric acid synthase n=1 Tax=Terrirubrum flagellatum TaxID=2895980 RepID=UPI00314515BD